jgi:hypothetical protein
MGTKIRKLRWRNYSVGIKSPAGGGIKKSSASRISFSQKSGLRFLWTVVSGMFVPKHETQPKGNRAGWRRKFSNNKRRDVRVTRTLRRAAWRVLRIWEHTLRWATKKPQNEARQLKRIRRVL